MGNRRALAALVCWRSSIARTRCYGSYRTGSGCVIGDDNRRFADARSAAGNANRSTSMEQSQQAGLDELDQQCRCRIVRRPTHCRREDPWHGWAFRRQLFIRLEIWHLIDALTYFEPAIWIRRRRWYSSADAADAKMDRRTGGESKCPEVTRISCANGVSPTCSRYAEY